MRLKRYTQLAAIVVAVFACATAHGQGSDDCATAQAVVLGPGDVVVVAVDNTAATTSPEPFAAGTCGAGVGTMQNDVWFSLAAPADGVMSFNTCAGALDTDMAIYTGTCATPTQAACNGDTAGCGPAGFGSSLGNFSVTSGTTYLIRVGGFSAADVGLTDLEISHFATFPPTGLACTVDAGTGDVTAAFTLPQIVDIVNIYVDGALFSTCCAAATGAQTQILSGIAAGFHSVCVESEVNGLPSPQVCCNVFIPFPCPPNQGELIPMTYTTLGGGVACGVAAAGTTVTSSYYRTYDLANSYGVLDEIDINCVTFGIDNSNINTGTTQAFRVRIHVDLNGGGPNNFTYSPAAPPAFPYPTPNVANTTFVMVYEEEFQIGDLVDQIYNFVLGTGIVDPDGIGANDASLACLSTYDAGAPIAGDNKLVVEVLASGGANGFWPLIGTGTITEVTVNDSWLSGHGGCGISVPTQTAGIGFASNRYIMELGYDIAAAGTCAPATGVAGLACNQNVGLQTFAMTWTNAATGGSLRILLDGTTVAQLAGTATTFTTAAQTPYTSVNAVVEAFTGPLVGGVVSGTLINQRACTLDVSPANNWAEGASIATVGTFQQVLQTPYTTTTGVPWTSCDTGTGLNDIANDIFFRYTASTTANVIVSTCNPGTVIVADDTLLAVYTYVPGQLGDPTLVVACNDDQGFGTFGTGNLACGAFLSELVFPATAGTEYLIRMGSSNAAFIGTLEYSISDCAPATGLAATYDCTDGDVTLTWVPTSNATSQTVLRDGVTVGTPSATATTFTDPAVPSGDYTYEIVTDCGSGPQPAAIAVSVLVYTGQTDLVFAVEGLETAGDFGATDSGPALLAALIANGRNAGLVRSSWLDYPCRTNAGVDNIWVMTGTFPDDYRIDVAEGDDLAALGAAGKSIYFEGGDQWGFAHVASTFDAMDGVDETLSADGGDTFTAMDGQDTGIGLDVSDLTVQGYNQDQVAANDWTDQLAVAAADANLTDAAAVWVNNDDTLTGEPAYITGVYGLGDAQGNVIVQSWEFGGFAGSQNVLALRYVNALAAGGTPLFRRGDCNIDGLFNIADPIFTLGILFPSPPNPPNVAQCADSCDANDDGLLNIADPISKLGALFPAGPPTPLPLPFPGCGPDPTQAAPDVFGCANYPSCP